MKTSKGINAQAWFQSQSFNGGSRIPAEDVMSERKYMVIEDGAAVILTKDRQNISCWATRQSDASMMTWAEAEVIAAKCRAFYGDDAVQIVGAHSVRS